MPDANLEAFGNNRLGDAMFFDEREFALSEVDFENPILPESFSRYAHKLDPDVLGDGLRETVSD